MIAKAAREIVGFVCASETQLGDDWAFAVKSCGSLGVYWS